MSWRQKCLGCDDGLRRKPRVAVVRAAGLSIGYLGLRQKRVCFFIDASSSVQYYSSAGHTLFPEYTHAFLLISITIRELGKTVPCLPTFSIQATNVHDAANPRDKHEPRR